jgi:hypothetical protein
VVHFCFLGISGQTFYRKLESSKTKPEETKFDNKKPLFPSDFGVDIKRPPSSSQSTVHHRRVWRQPVGRHRRRVGSAGWVRLGSVGSGWVRLGWVGSGWVGLGQVGLGRVELGQVGWVGQVDRSVALAVL